MPTLLYVEEFLESVERPIYEEPPQWQQTFAEQAETFFKRLNVSQKRLVKKYAEEMLRLHNCEPMLPPIEGTFDEKLFRGNSFTIDPLFGVDRGNRCFYITPLQRQSGAAYLECRVHWSFYYWQYDSKDGYTSDGAILFSQAAEEHSSTDDPLQYRLHGSLLHAIYTNPLLSPQGNVSTKDLAESLRVRRLL